MNDPLVNAIRAAADATRDTIVRDLQALVRIPSYSPASGGPGEGAAQDYLATAYAEMGCQIARFEPDVPALHAQFPTMRQSVQAADFAGRPNLIAYLPGAEPDTDERTAGVILNSHADTVPPGPVEAWPYPPLEGVVADGRIHGLGAADAKGCLVTFLGALRILAAAGVRLQRSVMVQSVVDEEMGGAGALACVARGYRAPVALVGEPTDLRVCPASRGSYTFTLTVTGKKSHPGSPWRGVNAIDKALICVEALRAMQRRLDRERMHPFWAPLPLGHVWNLMAINTGPSARAIPDHCTVTVGAGAVAGEDAAAIRAFVEEALAGAVTADPWLAEHPPEVVWTGLQMDASATDPGHPAIAAMVAAGASLGLETGVPAAFSAATDGRHLTNFGGVPCINFGPGDIGLCHGPRESLPVDELIAGATWVALFLARSLGVAR